VAGVRRHYSVASMRLRPRRCANLEGVQRLCVGRPFDCRVDPRLRASRTGTSSLRSSRAPSHGSRGCRSCKNVRTDRVALPGRTSLLPPGLTSQMYGRRSVRGSETDGPGVRCACSGADASRQPVRCRVSSTQHLGGADIYVGVRLPASCASCSARSVPTDTFCRWRR
jgi:hypothetical protein